MYFIAEQDQRTMAVTYTLKIDYQDIVKAEGKNNDGMLFKDIKDKNMPVYLKLYGLAVLVRQIENNLNKKEKDERSI